MANTFYRPASGVFLSGAGVQGAVQHGDRIPREVHAVTVDRRCTTPVRAETCKLVRPSRPSRSDQYGASAPQPADSRPGDVTAT